RKEHLNVSQSVLMTALEGPFIFSPSKAVNVPDFLIFSRDNSNEPCAQKAGWIMAQLLRTGSLRDPALLRTSSAQAVFRSDLYHKALKKTELENNQINHTNELVSS
ncbi:MAG: putative Nitrate transporter, partial [Verrucomicrobiales bacterium]|nr:putative Nitrate transporter [Verrucomicrobiales bacterium]